jgi:uncharacterized ferritin-like protein (DUF455 family)
MNKGSFFSQISQALFEPDPINKVAWVNALGAKQAELSALILSSLESEKNNAEIPANYNINAGRPDKPELICPRLVPRRRLGTPLGITAMVHALAHIEFNAINLALDACYRFRHMPLNFYLDWFKVAKEEAAHFMLLKNILNNRGHEYGDFEAHNSLWELADKTKHDVLNRMALVPRIMEARGLDVAPAIRDKLMTLGEQEIVDAMNIIIHDEEGHVEIGNRWFNYVCVSRNLDPEIVFQELVLQFAVKMIKKPFATNTRLKVGFTEKDMAFLESL